MENSGNGSESVASLHELLQTSTSSKSTLQSMKRQRNIQSHVTRVSQPSAHPSHQQTQGQNDPAGKGTTDLISLLQCSDVRRVAKNPRMSTPNAAVTVNMAPLSKPSHMSTPNSAIAVSLGPQSAVQQVVYVRPMGPQAVNTSVNGIPRNVNVFQNTQPSQSNSPMPFGTNMMVRGLSPQRNQKRSAYPYPSYLPIHATKVERSPNQPRSNNVIRPSGQTISSAVHANVHAGLSSVKRNLEFALGNKRRDNAAVENGSSASGSVSKRVRMGWSPAKRKHSNEKSGTPPPVLVISSDEEEEKKSTQDKPVPTSSKQNFGARLAFFQTQKRQPEISDTAVRIASQLPNSLVRIKHGEENKTLENLDYGLSLLNEPHKILDTLEEVLRERPKRLRVNLRSLYSHAKVGCLSKVLSILPLKSFIRTLFALKFIPALVVPFLRRDVTSADSSCYPKYRTWEAVVIKDKQFLPIILVMNEMHCEVEDLSPAASVHSEDGKSALHAAASKGHLDVLVVLVYKAAGNLDVMDKFKRTPLYIAVEKGHLKAAQFLQKAGASIAAKNFDGMGLMHVAAHKGHVKILKWLVTLKNTVNEQDNGGWTSLMWAAEDGNSEALKLLIKKGAKTDLRDKELNTVLHWASMAGALDGCEALLDARCDVNSVNMYGDTPLHISAREGNLDVVKLFLLRGADTAVKNKEDKMPMDVCINNPQVRDTVRLRHAIGHVKIRRQYDCDISRGKERIPVSCINEVDDEPLPLNFTYITEPVESHTVSIMKDLLTVKGCKCQDDCSLAICDCIQRNEDSRCWFDEGVLDMKFLDLDQPVLIECSKLCRCWSYCGNRVVQKGSQFRLEVFRTTNIGWGLRTICPIPKGSFVLSYVGEVISDEEADRRADDSYLFDLDMENSNDDDNCLDANIYGNCGRFINHSCEANLMPVRVFTHHRDWRFPGIAFFTSRDVDAYQELSFDYGDKFWEIKKKNGLRCQCNSSRCKYS